MKAVQTETGFYRAHTHHFRPPTTVIPVLSTGIQVIGVWMLEQTGVMRWKPAYLDCLNLIT